MGLGYVGRVIVIITSHQVLSPGSNFMPSGGVWYRRLLLVSPFLGVG